MSQRDGFTGGFFLGVVVGGIMGGVVGAIASRRSSEEERQGLFINSKTNASLTSEESIEGARRGLEEKIAQLNLAIDDVRSSLSSVNGNTVEKEID